MFAGQQPGGPGQNAPMRDFIRLNSSLISLSKKCTKVCTKLIENHFPSESTEKFYSKLRAQPQANQTYNICLRKCTGDYAQLNKHVRVSFMEDLDKIQETNQEIYENFYKK